jgi:hypothetical protein
MGPLGATAGSARNEVGVDGTGPALAHVAIHVGPLSHPRRQSTPNNGHTSTPFNSQNDRRTYPLHSHRLYCITFSAVYYVPRVG